MKFFLLIASFVFSTVALSTQGKDLMRLAIETNQKNRVVEYAWLDNRSSFEVNNVDIMDVSGVKLMNNPQTASSYNGVEYDISHFYKLKRPRINTILHYAGIKPGEILSLGFDSGFSAQKINIKPALFLGYTRALQMTKNAHIAFNVNGWIGGKISEKACLDEYDRAYYCATLTVWGDHKPLDEQQNFQQNIAFKLNF